MIEGIAGLLKVKSYIYQIFYFSPWVIGKEYQNWAAELEGKDMDANNRNWIS